MESNGMIMPGQMMDENWQGKVRLRKPSVQQYREHIDTLYAATTIGQESEPRNLLAAMRWPSQSLYMLATGKKVDFKAPPTQDYKFIANQSSVIGGGTVIELITSANPESRQTWDSIPNRPSYAALHHHPLICKQLARNVYWEYDYRHSGSTRGNVAIGFRVPEQTYFEEKSQRYDDIRSSADVMPVLSQCSVFWWSGDNSVWIHGQKVKDFTLNVGENSTVGIGLIFHYDRAYIPSIKEQKTKSKFSTWVENKKSVEAPVGNKEDLTPVETEIFFTVDGVKSKVPQELNFLWKDYINGMFDVYPAIVVSGAGVQGIAKFGQGVVWNGEGGKSEAHYISQGNRNLPGYKQPKWPFNVRMSTPQGLANTGSTI